MIIRTKLIFVRNVIQIQFILDGTDAFFIALNSKYSFIYPTVLGP